MSDIIIDAPKSTHPDAFTNTEQPLVTSPSSRKSKNTTATDPEMFTPIRGRKSQTAPEISVQEREDKAPLETRSASVPEFETKRSSANSKRIVIRKEPSPDAVARIQEADSMDAYMKFHHYSSEEVENDPYVGRLTFDLSLRFTDVTEFTNILSLVPSVKTLYLKHAYHLSAQHLIILQEKCLKLESLVIDCKLKNITFVLQKNIITTFKCTPIKIVFIRKDHEFSFQITRKKRLVSAGEETKKTINLDDNLYAFKITGSSLDNDQLIPLLNEMDEIEMLSLVDCPKITPDFISSPFLKHLKIKHFEFDGNFEKSENILTELHVYSPFGVNFIHYISLQSNKYILPGTFIDEEATQLLNKHYKVIRKKYPPDSSLSKFYGAYLKESPQGLFPEIFKFLRVLNLSDVRLTGDVFLSFPFRFPLLTHLELVGSATYHLTQGEVRRLAHLVIHRLNHLSLSMSHLDSADMISLFKYGHQLQSLNISGCAFFTKEALLSDEFLNLKLKKLGLSGCSGLSLKDIDSYLKSMPKSLKKITLHSWAHIAFLHGEEKLLQVKKKQWVETYPNVTFIFQQNQDDGGRG